MDPPIFTCLLPHVFVRSGPEVLLTSHPGLGVRLPRRSLRLLVLGILASPLQRRVLVSGIRQLVLLCQHIGVRRHQELLVDRPRWFEGRYHWRVHRQSFSSTGFRIYLHVCSILRVLLQQGSSLVPVLLTRNDVEVSLQVVSGTLIAVLQVACSLSHRGVGNNISRRRLVYHQNFHLVDKLLLARQLLISSRLFQQCHKLNGVSSATTTQGGCNLHERFQCSFLAGLLASTFGLLSIPLLLLLRLD